ncbi:dihydroorotate dehydrogenase electron transfer subunit [Dehalococcoides mccartyi]|uniref:dihydroorotate dehydrogenase electron transfer subunit n=1 Tax=Dehalococcoides mccartyi TaxID=61435 RepID=UPI0001BDC6AD|nr:dihydroorotate dehydrogenase electron transfer subunit [Dehalococcoides mccartyi]AGG08159.1 dihydroorotate dehydrogenase electron transfer subunit [Dehalococcoides mccartyi BTF08]AQU06202.1 dihydroorotate dehydrogenase [Dehalococcoides mccartyi]AQU07644.1 dihydroorotate dehydrogenase [Dehalococcoides mccartyi]AQW62674.1 dihydroorotate dehydrogenase [Dehalococcoides mccartyi]AQX73466.1 dihydroorotate dehydrogenase [Dehalococcoides mccartyi]
MTNTQLNQLSAGVIENEEVMPGICLMWLEAPEIAAVASPGQFVMLSCGGENLLRRPISIYQCLRETGLIALMYAVVGSGTNWLSKLQTGDSLSVLGPLGNGFRISEQSRHLLLLGGGLGIAPLRFLADEALKQGKRVSLIQGAKTELQVCPAHLLPEEASCHITTENGAMGRKGLITRHLAEFLADADQIIACGPMPMLKALSKESGLTQKDVQVSLEVRMACGLGICYGCAVKTTKGMKTVCHDGPVFDIQDIYWDEVKI